MRVVEAKMCKAISNATKMKVGNTQVCIDESGANFQVLLHGHKIIWGSTSGPTYYLSSGGWCSNTTKSRLNAFLGDFVPGVWVIQRKYEWYLHVFGIRALVPFEDGVEVPIRLWEFPKVFSELEKYF